MPRDAIARALVQYARDIILVIDGADGRLIDANQAALDAYRCAHADLCKLTIFDLRVDASPAVTEQMRKATEAGLLFETVHRRCDGTMFPVEVSSRGETIQGRNYLFSIIRDISERKRLEAARDEFLMIASHELRTPVTNISLQLQNLGRLLDRATPREQLRVVGLSALREAGRLGSLIDNLLVAEVVKDQFALERGDFELRDVVDDVVERLRARAEQSGSTLVARVPSARGHWDRLRLEQVLTNLILNAIKFGRGQPIEIRGDLSRDTVHVDICDRGIGIGIDDRARIFRKFERALPSSHGGLGLGLFIARRIAEAHGGSIELVDSCPGAGSTFRLTLPLTS